MNHEESGPAFGELLRVLRAHGVQSFRSSTGMEVVFFAPQAEPPPATDPQDGDRCACGHSISNEHNEHGCLRGCVFVLCKATDKEPLPG